MFNCPVCNGRSVGRIGTEQYYCWNCLVEYNSKKEVFQVEEDGSLKKTVV
ncbi:MAG: hypothetical protein AB1420_01075 [Bacillota bacterium]